ncbi:MAG: autotransporter-associated beta strand repeat-containing protein [Prolixibacteraceae bacterium]|nr:autotransporter-associated beta strand repeat-containing protein [Prolixibacteraceae bacterium]MBN2772979.1 autotransporter-associated beta strand repeat-containing protein [Prolixibacteraceae bacterium]
MKKTLLIVIITLFTGIFLQALSNNISEDADIIVARDGSGDFTSIQEAINAAPSNSERRTIIYIKRGLYNTEKLIVPANKINISLVGESREETIISYHIYNCGDSKCPAEDVALWTGDNISTSATLTIMADGFHAENMTIQNTAGPVGQAQAITVRSDKCVFINVDFYGYQDTMYFWSDGNRSYFEGCLIVGRTDYIYGSGTVFFQSCEIRSWGGGWITAPSTGQDQPYGFVFNECDITYAYNSPRGGDDGELVRFGRPWHNYPKVTWLKCNMTEMIHPQGWGDTWSMTYAATSDELHLYEYQNTGPGADMSGRANWAGIKELTTEEAAEYTVQKVMAGDDNWDPTNEASVVQNYAWTGEGETDGWVIAENWNPAGIPAAGDAAEVNGDYTIIATGGTFEADLILKNNAILDIAENSVTTYLSVARSTIASSESVSLNGKVATKDTIFLNTDGDLTLNSELIGVHELIKKGAGSLILNANNSNFSGAINILSGTLEASLAGSLGKSDVNVSNGASLNIKDDNALDAKSVLSVVSGVNLILNADVTTSEFYIDGTIQEIGEYSSSTNPDLISGSGKIIIGRPDTFTFHRAVNGNWDEPGNYTPALLPQAGETVICEEEMETTSIVFTADIILRGAGKLRLRGDESKNHTSAGTIYMENGTSFRYNTSGTGMYINAPLVIQGDVIMYMESGNSGGSAMMLPGNISGASKITALNNGKGTDNIGTLLLTGDNSEFKGTWDITKNSEKEPSSTGYITYLEGSSENAFGKGTIVAGLQNRIVFSHSKAAGDTLKLNLTGSAKVLLNTNVSVISFTLNGVNLDDGEYSVATNPDLFEGSGKIIVGSGEAPPEFRLPAFPGAEGHGKYTTGGRGGRVIYVTNLEDNTSPGSLRYAINQSGPRIILFKVSGTIQLKSRLNITKDDVTIAGQTAPGDGITLRDYPVAVDADNVIIRFMRFRMGDVTDQEADALGGREIKNVIIDHCSMGWSTDECVSFYQNENFTLQWCIVSESLRNSVHAKGAHGYGGIWGGKNASFHHNLLAHHDSRNPRLGEMAGTNFALTDLVDMRNNVIYNWQGNSAYGGEAMNANIVNCYYKPGPVTTKKERIISIDKNTEAGSPVYNIWGKFYIDGNVLTASTRATNDNWTYGVYNQFNSKYTVSQQEKEAMRLSEPLISGDVTTHSAEEAYERILDFCGASLVRDSVDIRVLHDLETGTATYMDGGNGSSKGIIDTQGAVGGWPELYSQDAPADSDDDGMPDDWENANGLDPDNDGDAQLVTVNAHYPNIETYINSLVSEIIDNQNEGGITKAKKEISSPENSFRIYYNNLSEELVLKHQKLIQEVKIYSISGQILMHQQVNQENVKMKVAGLMNGLYIVSIIDNNYHVFSTKIVKF